MQLPPGKIQIKAKNSKNLYVHYGVQTADVTIISYKPLSGLNFARYTGHYCSCMPSSPLHDFGVYKLLVGLSIPILAKVVTRVCSLLQTRVDPKARLHTICIDAHAVRADRWARPARASLASTVARAWLAIRAQRRRISS